MKKIIRAYKYRIYPNKKQKEFIDKTFGCCRFVYNFCRGNQKKEAIMWLLANEMVQQGYFDYNNYKSKFFNKFENLGNYIKLPKLKAVKFKDKSRPQGKIVKAIISKTSSNRYYVSLNCKEVLVQEYPNTNNKVGIDLGIADAAILSNGKRICNNQFLEKELNKITQLQRRLSR